MPALETIATEIVSEELHATWRSFHTLEEDLIRRHLHRFSETLTRSREALTGEEWKQCVDFLIRKHPVTDGFFQDPFTQRSFTKPRGYSGDAVLMDLIYHHASTRATVSQTTPLGQLLYRFTSTRESPQAVCARRDLLAAEIDRVAGERPRPAHVLALACGPLREGQLSRAVRGGALGRFVALDQDAASIAVVQREQAASGIQVVVAPIRSLLDAEKSQRLGAFDFVYAAGLFDYLSDRLARRLVAAMFHLLNPGGKLWVSNFLPGIPDLGYMEAFMDWWLIYRDAGQMEMLMEAIPAPRIAAHRIFTEPHRNVVFLEVVRHA